MIWRGENRSTGTQRSDQRQRVGRSEEGRPILLSWGGPATSPLRVLILAGQHGDEPYARLAVAQLAARWSQPNARAPQAQVALLANANPDGAQRHQRANVNAIDLNRDHQLLRSAEVRTIHGLVRLWQPHLVVDVHTYPPRRKHLLRDGLIHCHDIMLDWPTHPALPVAWHGRSSTAPLAALVDPLVENGFRCRRYTLITRSGRVRHSTPDVVDARNSLALRYGVQTLLVEGRQPSCNEDRAAGQRLLQALRLALEQIVRWAEDNSGWLTARRPATSAGALTAIGCRYRSAGVPCQMAFQDARTGTIRHLALPGPYTPALSVTHRVRLPTAYAVPLGQTELLRILRRHAFPERMARGARCQVTCYRVVRVHRSEKAGRAPREISLCVRPATRALDRHAIFPVTQDGGQALAVLLEPASKYGLCRLADARLPLTPGQDYPVLRVA